MKPLCENCEEGTLEPIDVDGDSFGYLCTNYASYERGRECNVLIDDATYKKLYTAASIKPAEKLSAAPKISAALLKSSRLGVPLKRPAALPQSLLTRPAQPQKSVLARPAASASLAKSPSRLPFKSPSTSVSPRPAVVRTVTKLAVKRKPVKSPDAEFGSDDDDAPKAGGGSDSEPPDPGSDYGDDPIFGKKKDDDDDADDDDCRALSQAEKENLMRHNTNAVITGALVVARKPLFPGLIVPPVSVLSNRIGGGSKAGRLGARPLVPLISAGLSKGGGGLGRPGLGKSPGSNVGGPTSAPSLLRRETIVPLCDMQIKALLALANSVGGAPKTAEQAVAAEEKGPPPDWIPLTLWEPTPEDVAAAAALDKPKKLGKIEVEYFLAKFCRAHQREGIRFLAECVLQQREFIGAGAILADDMGLGKTLQSVVLLYTLLTQGFEMEKVEPTPSPASVKDPKKNFVVPISKEAKAAAAAKIEAESYKSVPIVKRAIVCCPSSLVMNWKNELFKWCGDRPAVACVALSETSKDSVISGIDEFLQKSNPKPVLIISYETFRMHCERLVNRADSCDLLICDEAHRLKNDGTLIYQALNRLQCKRRILLSGTPMQNDLSEFFAMASFTNPGVLGDKSAFHRRFEKHILAGREPDATDKEREEGLVKTQELSAIVNQFILRRTNALLSKHLPPKVVEIVCCALTPLQQKIYQHFLKGKDIRLLLQQGKKSAQVLPLINTLKQLCNHPKLVYDSRRTSKLTGFEGVEQLFPENFEATASHPMHSGKMDTLDRLLTTVRRTTDDRFVLISNYTQTLDVLADLCKMRGWNYVRLDGTTSVKKRQKLVDQLTDRKNDIFCFLLSSKAGGCGLNLIGANRLVLFDPDWNPAVDKQAAARVWRDGQQKRCFVYRFFATGTIEEKVFQRQLSKEGLTGVMKGEADTTDVSTEELRDLFTYLPMENTRSDTHDTLSCPCHLKWKQHQQTPIPGYKGCLGQSETCASEEDLKGFSHHSSPATVPDELFRFAHSSGYVAPTKIEKAPARSSSMRVKSRVGSLHKAAKAEKENLSDDEVMSASDALSATATSDPGLPTHFTTFVMCMEVNGREVIGPAEERAKAMSCIGRTVEEEEEMAQAARAAEAPEMEWLDDDYAGEGRSSATSPVSSPHMALRTPAVPAALACGPCKRLRLPCSGGQPCARCNEKQIECVDQQAAVAPAGPALPAMTPEELEAMNRRKKPWLYGDSPAPAVQPAPTPTPARATKGKNAKSAASPTVAPSPAASPATSIKKASTTLAASKAAAAAAVKPPVSPIISSSSSSSASSTVVPSGAPVLHLAVPGAGGSTAAPISLTAASHDRIADQFPPASAETDDMVDEMVFDELPAATPAQPVLPASATSPLIGSLPSRPSPKKSPLPPSNSRLSLQNRRKEQTTPSASESRSSSLAALQAPDFDADEASRLLIAQLLAADKEENVKKPTTRRISKGKAATSTPNAPPSSASSTRRSQPTRTLVELSSDDDDDDASLPRSVPESSPASVVPKSQSQSPKKPASRKPVTQPQSGDESSDFLSD